MTWGYSPVFRNSLRRILLTASALGALHAVADTGAVAGAYGVLNRFGLLEKAPSEDTVAASAAVSTTVRSGTAVSAIDPAPAAESDDTPSPPVQLAMVSVDRRESPPVRRAAPAASPAPPADNLPKAYQLLRRLGLLKPESSGKADAVAKADSGRRVDRVLVDKSERTLQLLKNGKVIREFPISLGAMPNGPKVKAGDLRTPEGEYTLDWRNPNSRFYKSIHISYPNETDRRRAAQLGVDPGGMIMIHGEHYLDSLRQIYRRATRKDWTEGCIAINNEHMDELWATVQDGTPIEIRP